MSESNTAAITTTTTTTTSASNIVASIPELLDIIAQHLHQSDYVSCIQVCHFWSEIFTPLLWHTVDTRTRAWGKIIVTYTSEEASRAEIKRQILSNIAKHGHHIRHLTVSWDILLEAASLSSSTCTYLCSLAAFSIGFSPGPASTKATPTAATLSEAATETAMSTSMTMETSTSRQTTAREGRIPFPIRERIRVQPGDAMRHHAIECFYSLVIRNPGLTSLTFPHLTSRIDATAEYRLSALHSMRHLKELNLRQTGLNLDTLLSNMPQLERLGIQDHHSPDLFSIRHDYAGICSLHLSASLQLSLMHKMLGRFPGLEELKFKCVRLEHYSDVCKILRPLPQYRSLKILLVEDTTLIDDKWIALLVSQFPGLVRTRLGARIYCETRKALYKNCYYLEEAHGESARDMDVWRQRREEDAENRQAL